MERIGHGTNEKWNEFVNQFGEHCFIFLTKHFDDGTQYTHSTTAATIIVLAIYSTTATLVIFLLSSTPLSSLARLLF